MLVNLGVRFSNADWYAQCHVCQQHISRQACREYVCLLPGCVFDVVSRGGPVSRILRMKFETVKNCPVLAVLWTGRVECAGPNSPLWHDICASVVFSVYFGGAADAMFTWSCVPHVQHQPPVTLLSCLKWKVMQAVIIWILMSVVTFFFVKWSMLLVFLLPKPRQLIS